MSRAQGLLWKCFTFKEHNNHNIVVKIFLNTSFSKNINYEDSPALLCIICNLSNCSASFHDSLFSFNIIAVSALNYIACRGCCSWPRQFQRIPNLSMILGRAGIELNLIEEPLGSSWCDWHLIQSRQCWKEIRLLATISLYWITRGKQTVGSLPVKEVSNNVYVAATRPLGYSTTQPQ